MFNVDFVFPYVNSQDKDWQRQYSYCTGTKFNEKDERFRDFSLLKYIFRSIDIYAPWINKVVMIISSKTQIPSFLRKDFYRLKFVEHKDFIDPFYLPTFNSNTIEMFIPNINCIEEHFIYSNDDLLFINPTTKDNFFSNDGKMIKLAYTKRKTINLNPFQICCKKSWDTVDNLFTTSAPIKGDFTYIKQYHGSASPRLMSHCKECFNEAKNEIYKSLTMFRSGDINLNQYMYGYYSIFKGNIISVNNESIGSYVSASDGLSKIKDTIFHCPSKMLCINDTKLMTKEWMYKIYNYLEEKFPKKSSFEV